MTEKQRLILLIFIVIIAIGMTFFAFYLETETDFSKYRHQKAVDYYMNEREEKMVRMRALAKELMEKYPNDEERLAQVLFLINEVYLDTRRAIKL